MNRISRTGLSLALALALFVPSLSAQGGGLKGGLSLADLIGGDVQSSETRTGLNAGGAMTLLRIGPVSVGPELYYAQKGADAARLGVESPAMFEQFGLDYLEVPLIGKISIGIPGVQFLHAYAQGGPAFAWKLHCNIERDEEGQAQLNDDCAFAQNQDAQAFIDSADRGVVLGGGVNINVMNFGVINLDGRHVRGLSRLAEGTGTPEVRNRATSLMVGYSFGW